MTEDILTLESEIEQKNETLQYIVESLLEHCYTLTLNNDNHLMNIMK